MERQLDSNLFGRGDHTLQKVQEIGPEFVLADAPVLCQQRLQILGLVARVPAGKVDPLLRINPVDQVRIEAQRRRAVVKLQLKGGARPIENGHEVVTDDLQATLREIAQRLRKVPDQAIARRASELDVLVYRDAFCHLEFQAVGFDQRFECSDIVERPHLADRNVVDGGDDAVDARDLANMGEWHGVGCAIPAKSHLQSNNSFVLRDHPAFPKWSGNLARVRAHEPPSQRLLFRKISGVPAGTGRSACSMETRFMSSGWSEIFAPAGKPAAARAIHGSVRPSIAASLRSYWKPPDDWLGQ